MLGHSYLFVTEDEVETLTDEEAVSEILKLSILPQIADILTSMNKTNIGIVNEINSKLDPLSDIGASSHILKEPVVKKNSLDIAVTVIEAVYWDAPLFQYSEAHIQHLGNGRVKAIAGSKLKEQTSEARAGDINTIDKLIAENVIVVSDDGTREFVKDFEFNSASQIGRIINGRESHEGPSKWKNDSGESLRDYYPDVTELQKKEKL